MNNFTLRVNISSYLLIIFFSIFYVQSSIAHSCVPAVIDGVTSSGNNICPGEPVTLTVDGYLWDVKEWRWYDGDCSSAATIVGVGPSITVNPSSTTTYFVAGIGGCIGEDPSLYYIGCQGITIFVTAPEISGCPASQDVSVNENCEFILPNYLNNITVTDNCGGTPTLTQSPPVGFVMDPNTPSGSTTVTITATDGSGNTSSCTFSLTAIDDTAPSISCPGTQNIPLDASCLSSHNNYIGLAIFSDNCGSVAVSQDPPEGTLITENTTATLTATDASGNTSSCTFVVNVVDQNAPSAICQNLTVQLDAGGEAIITAYDVDSGSSDNCGIASLAISQSSFNCTNIGVNSVVLTVTDAGGNQAVCTATVTVADDINPCCEAPVITCPSDITINCTESSEPSNTGQATFTDGCGLVNLTHTDLETLGNCTGNFTISRTWTATDEEQNTAICVQTITVQDNTAPTPLCQDITVQLDENGNASITASQIDNGSTDVCGSVTTSIDIYSFGCYDLGDHTVTLTVTDDCGNQSSCTATVTVEGPDEDCDTVADICDVCPGGDDTIDNNGDNLPDCANYPGYENVIDDWKCGNNKVYMCHAPPGNPNNRTTICVNKNAVSSHMAHGDYLGPCDNANCSNPVPMVSNPFQLDQAQGQQVGNPNLDIAPNPFTSETTISVYLPKEGFTSIEIYNLNGQRINQLYSGNLVTGYHQISWQGDSQDGAKLQNGIYFIVLKTSDQVLTKKASLIK